MTDPNAELKHWHDVEQMRQCSLWCYDVWSADNKFTEYTSLWEWIWSSMMTIWKTNHPRKS